MKESGISVYVVPTGDYHISEYAGDYFKEREFITGFTGSAGTAVIDMDKAVLLPMEDTMCRRKSSLTAVL